VAVAVADQRIYAPIAGRIEHIYVQRGQAVRPGQTLLRITNPAHDTEREIIRFATAQADIRIRRAQVSATHRTQLIGLTEQRARLGAEQATIAQLQAAGTVTAQVGGTVVAWDASLRTGASVMRGSYLGRIVEPDRMKLHCYIPERVLGQVKLGDALRYVDAATGRSASATIHRISPMRLGQLEHATLSSRTGGPIAVTIDPNGRMIPLDAWYLAEATLARSTHARPRIGQPGQAWYIVRNESRARRWLGQLTTWLLSESGF
jgi:biotin carboxyl carrier protein